jgi:predicted O-methyltransferase YrrM
MIVTDEVSGYIDAIRPAPDAVLAQMEAHGERERIPIVPPETGAFLQVLALAHGAKRIVEVGTAIGVSTLYLARALPPDDGAVVVSFEIDERRHVAARDYLDRAGLSRRVDLRLQDAREGLAELERQSFDFAFLDGVKAEYGDYFDHVVPLLDAGGVLAVDNVLMAGAVAGGRGDGNWTDSQVRVMRAFNERLLNSPEWTATVTTVGDGVLVAVRR